MSLVYAGIRVTDLERSVRFFTQGLGLVETHRGRMDHGGVFVELRDPDTDVELELNWYPPHSPYHTPYVTGEALDHLGFEVDDVPATIERLVRLGGRVAVAPWLERERYWIGFVEGPDGIWVEVSSPVPRAPTAPSGPS
jgi:lactoylglutathione lyase